MTSNKFLTKIRLSLNRKENLPSWVFHLCILAFCCLTPPYPLLAQGWQIYPAFQNYDFAKDALPTPDGGYLITGHTGLSSDFHDIYLLKLDPFGQEQWRRTLGGPAYDAVDDMVALPDGTFVLVGATFSFGNGGSDVYLIKVNRLGETIWEKTIGTADLEFARRIIHTSDGGFAISGRFDNGADVGILVMKTDADGNEEWTNIYGGTDEDEGWSLVENSNQELLIIGSTRSFGQGERDVYLLNVGLNGIFNWAQAYGGTADELGTEVIATSDGGLLLGGATASFGAGDYDVWMIKTDAVGNEVWNQTFGGAGGEWGALLQETPQGDFIAAGTSRSFNNAEDDIYLFRTDPQGNLLWQRFFGQNRKEVPHSLELSTDGGLLIGGHARIDLAGGAGIQTSQSFLVKTDASGNAFSNYFSGKIFADENNDCLFQQGERGFANWVLVAQSTTTDKVFYGLTDVDGNYSILTDTGQYALTLTLPNEYWQPCSNNIPLALVNLYDTIFAEFPLRREILCPQLEVDMAASVVRPCEMVEYQIRYCNHGTVDATDAIVEISLDEFYAFENADLPLAGQMGNVFQFNVGSVEPGDCGTFAMEARLDCNVELGRTHSVEALIKPDSICLDNDPQWDQSSIDLSAKCLGDSVEFTIKNIGSGGMSEPLGFIIIEDQIMTRALNIQLLDGDSAKIKHPANGRMIRMQIERPIIGHPGKSNPSIHIEGCTASGPISTGFVNQWPEDDGDRFKSIDCRESAGHVPLNEKLASPKGIGILNYIQPATDIEYQIHFQNTGEDTISTVVIQDTLSHWLDLTSIRPGAGSHPYELEMSNTGVLQFTFKQIELPDSTSNEVASHGFIKFRISQLPDVPVDSQIINRSCVTFDFDQPEAKPVYFHTLQKPKVFSISDVSLCTGGFVGGVAISGDTSLFELNQQSTVDSLYFTNVTAWPTYDILIQDTTCANEPYLFIDELLDMPGFYDTLFFTALGCDSLLTLQLAHLDIPQLTVQDTTCENEPYLFNGDLLDSAGTYDAFFTAANGCDSIVTLQLSVDTLFMENVDTALAIGSEFLGIVLNNDTLLTEITSGDLDCDTIYNWRVDVFTNYINPQISSSLQLIPNPFNDFIIIKNNAPHLFISKIELFNDQGKVIKAAFLEKNQIITKYEFEASGVIHGIYFMKITTEKGVTVKKIIKLPE